MGDILYKKGKQPTPIGQKRNLLGLFHSVE